MDLQLKLSRALERRSLSSFKEALTHQANANEPDVYGVTIFEKALATAGCKEFIKLCLQYGCKADYLNKMNKAAINFASDSRDSDNVRTVLEHEGNHVDNKYNDLTPLNSLAKNLNEANAKQVKECMNLLLCHGASPNIPDDTDMYPLHYVVYNKKIALNQKQELIELFVKHPGIYIDAELYEELRAWNPNLAPNLNPSMEVNSVRLLNLLRDGNEQEFQRLLSNYQGDRSDLLVECIKEGRHESFEHLLKDPFDVNGKSQGSNKTYVEIAIANGNWYVLDNLLQHEKLKLPKNLELLHKIIGRLDERPQRPFSDFVKCFYILLKSRHVNVNEKDKSGRTPLHYAILYNYEFAVNQLLHNGASLSIRSEFKELPIEDIDPRLLKDHFDNCITSEGLRHGDKNFKIILNYKTLKVPSDMEKEKCSDMEPLRAMAKSKNLRHLLNHPLITTLISLKWKSISLLFYLYFGLSMFFSIFYIVNIFLIFFFDNDSKLIFKCLSCLSTAYFVVCELFKLYLTGIFFSRSRILNVSLIILSVISSVVSSPEPEEYYNRAFVVFTILLYAVHITRLIGSLPIYSLSKYVLMLREVCYTFLKSCIPYIFLVVSFGLCFYILKLHNLPEKHIMETVLKTIIMSTGEFDESNIEFKNKFFDRLFFIIYVVFITIVLMNLLMALAFSDIQAIQALGDLNSLICLVNLLSCYEACLIKSWGCIEPIRFGKIKVANLPELILTFPNKKHDQSETCLTANSTELRPLINGDGRGKGNQYNIIIPEDTISMEFNNATIKRFLQLIDQKSTKTSDQRT